MAVDHIRAVRSDFTLGSTGGMPFLFGLKRPKHQAPGDSLKVFPDWGLAQSGVL